VRKAPKSIDTPESNLLTTEIVFIRAWANKAWPDLEEGGRIAPGRDHGAKRVEKLRSNGPEASVKLATQLCARSDALIGAVKALK
jgi:hypothetical protein